MSGAEFSMTIQMDVRKLQKSQNASFNHYSPKGSRTYATTSSCIKQIYARNTTLEREISMARSCITLRQVMERVDNLRRWRQETEQALPGVVKSIVEGKRRGIRINGRAGRLQKQ